MLILVAQIIFGISVLGILFILFRKVPILLRYPRHSFEEISLYGFLQKLKNRMLANDFFHLKIFPLLEKILRKIKIWVLKLDNVLAKLVSRLRHKRKNIEEEIETKNGNNNHPDFSI